MNADPATVRGMKWRLVEPVRRFDAAHPRTTTMLVWLALVALLVLVCWAATYLPVGSL